MATADAIDRPSLERRICLARRTPPHNGAGIALGVLGGTLAGAAIASAQPYYYSYSYPAYGYAYPGYGYYYPY